MESHPVREEILWSRQAEAHIELLRQSTATSSATTEATAQTNLEPKPLEFEVASVKPIDLNGPIRVGVQVFSGGRVVISGLSLKAIVATAFGMSFRQISGADDWTGKDLYVVEARPPGNAKISDLRHTLFAIEDEHLREMLRALLVDRFQLKFHRETKPGDVFLLVRNDKPPGLSPSRIDHEDEGSSPTRSAFGSIGYAGGRWVLSNTTMQQLARFAADLIVHAPVSDRTELSGSFDYKQAIPDEKPDYGDNTESFLRLLPDLGLKLERSKGTIETLVIDQAAKPSPN
jgi:uncharacterized protein (TIGR03435 family)